MAQQENLDSFSWDTPDEDIFFGIKTDTSDKKEIDAIIEEVKKDVTPKVKGETKEPKEVRFDFSENNSSNNTEDDGEDEDLETEDVFKQNKVNSKLDIGADIPDKEDKKDKKEVTNTKETNEEEEINPYVAFAKDLKENGVFANVDIPEGDLNSDQIFELQEKEVEARVDETIKGIFEGISDKGRDFINFVKDGGDPEKFFKMHTITSVPEYIEGNESAKEDVIKYYLKNIEKQDDEDIKDSLEVIEENGKKDKLAKRYSEIIKQRAEESRTKLLADQKKELEKTIANQKAYFDLVDTKLKEVKQVKGIEITDIDKKKLYNYMLKPTVKVGDNQYQTPMATKIQDILTNPKNLDKAILLAKLLESDFDTSSIIKTKVTQEVKKTKNSLEVALSGSKKVSGGSANRPKELADFF